MLHVNTSLWYFVHIQVNVDTEQCRERIVSFIIAINVSI